jgi:hypothetical protein
MEGFDYIHIFLFVLTIILIFALRQETKEKSYYEEKAISEERLKNALEYELNFPNMDWKEFKVIEELINKMPSDFKTMEELKDKYYKAIISIYKTKQGR